MARDPLLVLGDDTSSCTERRSLILFELTSAKSSWEWLSKISALDSLFISWSLASSVDLSDALCVSTDGTKLGDCTVEEGVAVAVGLVDAADVDATLVGEPLTLFALELSFSDRFEMDESSEGQGDVAVFGTSTLILAFPGYN